MDETSTGRTSDIATPSAAYIFDPSAAVIETILPNPLNLEPQRY